MFKKALSLLLSLMLIITSLSVTALSVNAADILYVVAGTANLCDEAWSFTEESGNIMTEKEDGTYELVFSPAEALGTVQIKVGKLTDGVVASDADYFGDETGNNITFEVTDGGDVTVTFDPATSKVDVKGDYVTLITELSIDAIRTVGGGDGNWLNNANWDPADDSNMMTEVSSKVYEITYEDLDAFDNYEFKFAANGSWVDNWGGNVNSTEAVYNGSNITFEVADDASTVKIVLDLTNFNYATKMGAVYKIFVNDVQVNGSTEEPTAAPTTAAPTTEPTAAPTTAAPTTVAPTTAAPADKLLTVKATSNFFEGSEATYKNAETVTVTYMLNANKRLFEDQWTLYFDNTKLRYTDALNDYTNSISPLVSEDGIIGPDSEDGSMGESMKNNYHPEESPEGYYTGCIKGNFTKLHHNPMLNDNGDDVIFVSVTFEVIGSGEATVDLHMEVLSLVDNDPKTKKEIESTEEDVVNFSTIQEYYTPVKAISVIESVEGEPTTTAPTEPETTVAPETTAPTEPETTVPVTGIWTVAGDEGLTGVMWDAAENEMTQGEYTFDGASYDYMIQFDDVAAGSYGCKVTNGTWDECYPEANVPITTNDTGYVKVYFNSTTKEIAVDAEYAFTWELEYITAVGNGDGTWLNGESWAVDSTDNRMTEVEPGIWEITYEDMDAFDNYQVKFACNGSWQPYNWTIDGILDGQDNPSCEVAEDGSTVTLRIDVNGFDFATGTGTVVPQFIVTGPVEPTTEATEPTTEATEPTTEATEPTTEATEPTTVGKSLTVKATSNLFPETTKHYDTLPQTVTVSYMINADKRLFEDQWVLNFDSSVLKYRDELNDYSYSISPLVAEDGFIGPEPHTEEEIAAGETSESVKNKKNYIKGNFTKLHHNPMLNADGEDVIFVSVTFEVVGSGDTTVDLHVQELSLVDNDPNTKNEIESTEEDIVNNEIIKEHYTPVTFKTLIDGDLVPPVTEPTTEVAEPTTEATEPTTEPETTVPVAGIWTVAGDEGLTGVMWDPATNEMAQGEYTFNDGSYDYMIQFDDVAAGSYGFKVTNGTWDECYPDSNFPVTTNDTGYVKVYFNSATKEIAVDAEYAFDWELEYITAVGNGDGTWLNGESWAVDSVDNRMTEVQPGIWEITYEDMDAFDNYQVKFACNGSWQPYNWTIDAVLDGQDNPSNEVAEDGSTVILRINVNGFDFTTGTGTVVPEFIVIPPVEPTTEATEPTTEEPTTTAPVEPTTEATEPTTEEPTTVPHTLDIIATSNFFPESYYTVDYEANMLREFTVIYRLDSAKSLLDTQWTLSYDTSKLELVTTDGFMPFAGDLAMYNTNEAGYVKGSVSNLNLFELPDGTVFVQATFRAIGTGETVVDLRVEDLTLSAGSEDTEESVVMNSQVMQTETPCGVGTEIVEGVPATEPTEEPTTAPVTEPTTEATEPTTEEPTTAPVTEPTTEATEPTTEEPTTAPVTEPTTEATEPTTEEPTTAPVTEPTTEATEPTTEEPTTAPVTEPTTEATEPTTEEPTTAPVEPTTDAPATDAPTPDATGATSATGTTVKGDSTADQKSTADTTNKQSTNAVQTGSAPMALVILAVLVSATGAIYFTRKRTNK